MKRPYSLLATLLLISSAHVAQAQSFACGQHIVETGMGTTKEEVLDKCGPPTVMEGDRWYYKHQPGQVTVILTFETGKLNLIQEVPE